MTFSYSFVWYGWEDWERLLDWAVLRGINLQLAWVGYEKIYLDAFRDIGLTDDQILPFFSGPAFQAWNRFGNIQGSWGDGDGAGTSLPLSWIEEQFALQKRIVARMVELGITPVLPVFTGFVPKALTSVFPNASVTQASQWVGMPEANTMDSFLSPLDDLYGRLQKSFISKQIEAFGNVTNVYTLDQFNEMTPASWDPAYLLSVSNSTYDALSAANPAAIWMLQGWLFFNDGHWTEERIDAYLGGPKDKNSMLILDLYSDERPQWQRAKSYNGRPWIWCELHDFGGNMGLFGKVQNVTAGPVQALQASDSLVGFGLTPEGYEGNEIVYDLLLDQAWSAAVLDTQQYFHSWVSLRYASAKQIPDTAYDAWEILRQHVYSVADPDIRCSGVGVYQLAPSLTGLLNRTGNYPAPTKIVYDPQVLVKAWTLLLESATTDPSLWTVPSFQLDFVDVTRQVMSNAFNDLYEHFVGTYNDAITGHQASANASKSVAQEGQKLLRFLVALDTVLATNRHFSLDQWIDSAQHWANLTNAHDLIQFNALSQITVWQIDAPALNDYAVKEWSGLTRSYFRGRWSIFVDALVHAVEVGSLNQAALDQSILQFEASWQKGDVSYGQKCKSLSIQQAVKSVQRDYPDVLPTLH